MTEETKPTNDVKSTSVSITLNAKSLGVDAFIKLEQTNEFVNPVSEVDALVKREEIAGLLTEQALAIVTDAANTVRKFIEDNGLKTVSTPAPAGTGADAIRAVANGAQPGGDWRVAVDTFDSSKQVRYLSIQSLPTESMKAQAAAFITSNGLNPESFDVWDERKDAEAGKSISSVCNIKIKEAFRNQVPAELCFTDKGGVKAVARAKFNSDGSLYFYWANKQVDAAVKYGAFAALS